jgi:hypothetical protein
MENENYQQKTGFEILTAMNKMMEVFWVAVSGRQVEVYHSFRGPCCLHHQCDE